MRIGDISVMTYTSSRALMVALALSTLGGCAKHSENHFTVGSTPQTYKQRHPIVLDERERTLDMPVARRFSAFTREERLKIEGFAAEFGSTGGTTMQVLVPTGSANAKAALTAGRSAADLLRQAGVPSHRLSVLHYDGSAHGSVAPVRLAYGTVTASVEGCGRWDKDLTVTQDNDNYTNFGCATQNNLAEMVANPADLLGPRATSPIETGRRTKVVSDYISGNVTSSDGELNGVNEIYR